MEDDISTDLDIAMLARREGIPGKRTPDGILTRCAAMTLGRFISEIEAHPDPRIIDLGSMLLTLNEKAFIEISQGIDKLAELARKDGKNHDLTVGLEQGALGLTVHCNNDPIEIAGRALETHCHSRKYTERAESWFGVCVYPGNSSLRFGLHLEYNWESSDEMDAITQNLPKPGGLSELRRSTILKKGKIGRNARCPCGSGRKYKRCCLSLSVFKQMGQMFGLAKGVFCASFSCYAACR